MSAICVDGDLAGGEMVASSSDFYINGKKVVLNGDQVKSHGLAPHNAATMTASTSNFLVNGKGVVKSGDTASCGHIASSSVTNVYVG